MHYDKTETNSPEITPEPKDNIVTVAVVKVDSVLYDTDDREETKESIRVILVKIRIEDNIEALYREIIANINPKLWEERESFYNTTRVRLNYRQELIIGEKEKEQISYPQFIELRKGD